MKGSRSFGWLGGIALLLSIVADTSSFEQPESIDAKERVGRLEKLKRTASQLSDIVLHDDPEALSLFVGENHDVRIDLDSYLTGKEVKEQLKNRRGRVYCHFFDTACYRKTIPYDYLAERIQSIRDILTQAKKVKLHVEFVTSRQEGTNLLTEVADLGNVQITWEGKASDYGWNFFPSAWFYYEQGQWRLDSLFLEQ